MRRLALCLLLFLNTVDCSTVPAVNWEEHATPTAFGSGNGELADRESVVYATSWNGIPAGRAVFRSCRYPDRYETEGNVETTGFAAMVHGVALRFEAVSAEIDLLSRRWKFAQEDKKTVDIRFRPSASRILSEIRSEGSIEKLALEGRGLYEPLGAIYALRRSELVAGRTYRVRMFAERNFYRADILVTNRVRIRVPAGEFDTWHVRADITLLENGVPVADPRPQSIWLTADERRIPVKVDIKTDIGRIVLTMRSYEVEGRETASVPQEPVDLRISST
jgi:hypothetical protein